MRKYLTKKEVIAIYTAEGTLREIADTHGTSLAHVGRIKRGDIYREITSILPCTPSKNYRALRSSSRLTVERIREIENCTYSVRVAAKALGVSRCTIQRYRNRANGAGASV
jgi:DNA invertase Pin-like site-specific DNA recombinase